MNSPHPAKGLPFDRKFQSFGQAADAGYGSATAWGREGRVVKADAIPSLMVKATAKVRGASDWHFVLEDLGDDYFITAADCYLVYRLEQTVPKTVRAKMPKIKVPRVKKAAFYVPINYDPFQLPAEFQDYAFYFLNLLHWKWINWRADHNGFVRLKHDYIIKVIPKHILYEIRDRLDAEGVIRWDRSYCPNHKSFGFRIGEEYRQTHRIECGNDDLNQKLAKMAKESEASHLPVHRWLRQKLDLLNFDMELAEETVDLLKPDADSDLAIGEYHTLLLEIGKKIADGESFFTVDRFGRVHTPITSLAKQLRPCLLVGEKNLVGIDLANSQPLIAGICAIQFSRSGRCKQRLLNSSFDENVVRYRSHELHYMEEYVKEIIQPQGSTPAPHRPITTEGNTQVIGNTDTYDNRNLHSAVVNNDLKEYLELCGNGTFYEGLMDASDERSDFKQKLYRDVFFGKNIVRTKLKERFEKRFPTVASMLHELKRKDYQRAAWLMQSYESTIFINGVCRRLMMERPEIMVFTIHDSILTLPEDLEFVRQVILEEFAKLGIRPTLKEERYG